MGILKKITDAARARTTYRAGLLQAKAYRILKRHTAEALSEAGISTVEWALLGLLFDEREGIRAGEAAEMLGVEAPFVTAIAGKLSRMELLSQESDPKDGRVRILKIAAKGREFVPKTEKSLRSHTQRLIAGVSAGDILGYLAVLHKIVENGEKLGVSAAQSSEKE